MSHAPVPRRSPGGELVFDRGSIAANRAGSLTRGQVATSDGAAALGGCFLALAVLGVGGLGNGGAPVGSQVPPLNWIVIGAIGAAAGLAWYRYATRGTRDGRVATVVGAIRLDPPDPIPLGRGPVRYRYAIRVGRQRFADVARDMYDAAPSEGQVRLYYRVGDHKAVNFEVLGQTREDRPAD